MHTYNYHGSYEHYLISDDTMNIFYGMSAMFLNSSSNAHLSLMTTLCSNVSRWFLRQYPYSPYGWAGSALWAASAIRLAFAKAPTLSPDGEKNTASMVAPLLRSSTCHPGCSESSSEKRSFREACASGRPSIYPRYSTSSLFPGATAEPVAFRVCAACSAGTLSLASEIPPSAVPLYPVMCMPSSIQVWCVGPAAAEVADDIADGCAAPPLGLENSSAASPSATTVMARTSTRPLPCISDWSRLWSSRNAPGSTWRDHRGI